MNKYNKPIITSVGVFLASSIFVLANAMPPVPVPRPSPQAPLPEIVHTVGDLRSAITDIENIDGAPENCMVERVVFARGIQSYKSDGDEWSATGPLAQLFDADVDLVDALINAPDSDEITIVEDDDMTDKIGTHYQSLARPAWEFGAPIAGRAIVVAGSVLKLSSPDGYIAWLNVGLEDGIPVLGSLGYNGLYRVLTIGGVAPAYNGQPGATVGSGYTTFYVFLSGCTPPPA